MRDIKALADMIRALEPQLRRCARCGMCQSVCPLYGETALEGDVARGKLALLDGLAQKLFEDSRGVAERLQRCLLCGSCAHNCPSGVDVLGIFLKARVVLAAYLGLSPLKKLALRGMLARPAVFDLLAEWAARCQGLFFRSDRTETGGEDPRFVSPLAGARHVVPLAKTPFHRRPEAKSAAATKELSGPRTAFFTGCLIDKFFPKIAEAALKVLDHYRIPVWVPEGQGCCGIPALSAGDLPAFERLVEHHLDLLAAESFDYLLTACPTCAFVLKTVWPSMLSGASPRLQAQAREVSSRVMDISRFLVAIAGVEPVQTSPRQGAEIVTIHDPCHLKKSMGVAAEPRLLIRANPNYRLVEMQGADACCGMGGTFNLEHHGLSTDIGRRKRDSIAATGCAVAAAGCPACMLQIADMLSRAGDRVRVRHPIEIYRESLPE